MKMVYVLLRMVEIVFYPVIYGADGNVARNHNSQQHNQATHLFRYRKRAPKNTPHETRKNGKNPETGETENNWHCSKATSQWQTEPRKHDPSS